MLILHVFNSKTTHNPHQMAIKILATGDLHLGKRSSGIPGNEPAGSAIYTWELIVNWCLDNDVDALALLGDIVDKENRIYQAVGPLFNGFSKLQEKGIQVFMVSGNHDYDVPGQLDRSAGLGNVTLLGRNGKWEQKSFTRGNMTVQLFGWSFPGDSVMYNPLLDLNGLDFDRSQPVIGLLHCDVNALNSPYAPVPLSSLISKQPDAWLLGHIHKPMELHRSMPMVRYTGSPHAFSAKEPGEHGPLLVTVNGKNDISASTIPLSPVRYETITVETEPGMQHAAFRTRFMQQLLEDVVAKKHASKHLEYLVYDVELTGSHEHLAEVDLWINELENAVPANSGEVQYAIRKVGSSVVTHITGLEEYVSDNTPVGLLAGTILALQENRSTPLLERLMEKWMTNYRNMENAATYTILGNPPMDKEALSGLARASILKECNRMISELVNQQPD